MKSITCFYCVFGSGKRKMMWQTQCIICFYSTLLEMTAEGQNRTKNDRSIFWGSDMIYHDFNINFFLSPYVCDLNAAWCLLKQATRLRGPELGQDRQWIPWGFFKSISARCLLLWCLDLFFSLCFCLVSLYVYLCSYVFVCVCWYLFTGTCVMACKRSRLRWWNRFGNRCHVKLPMWRDVFV